MLEHRHCGTRTTAILTCDVCGEPLDARSVRAVAGPGATDESPLHTDQGGQRLTRG
ncbi:MAG: hypothetical protein ACFCVK_06825 [Acidimicrobiales bacterium]